MTGPRSSGLRQAALRRVPDAAPTSGPGTVDFEALFRDNYEFVCRVLFFLGVARPWVEDAAQDVFLVLHRRFDVFDPEAPARNWLWGIARRVAHDYRRSAQRTRRRLKALPSARDHGNPPAAGDAESVHVVETLLRQLPRAQREVFILADLEGWTAPEIATASGVRLNTVYSRLRSARQRLRTLVDQSGAEARKGEGS